MNLSLWPVHRTRFSGAGRGITADVGLEVGKGSWLRGAISDVGEGKVMGVECRRFALIENGSVASSSEAGDVGDEISASSLVSSGSEPGATFEISSAHLCSYASHAAGARSCARRSTSPAALCPGQNVS